MRKITIENIDMLTDEQEKYLRQTLMDMNLEFKDETEKKRFHIIIEGTEEDEMQDFFEEIQNEYSLYDNCVLEEVIEEDSIISKEDRCIETGKIACRRPPQAGKEPKD